MTRTEIVCDNATALERILERCPKHIVAAIPLGLGKPNRLLKRMAKTGESFYGTAEKKVA